MFFLMGGGCSNTLIQSPYNYTDIICTATRITPQAKGPLSFLRRLSSVLPEIQSDAVHLYIGLLENAKLIKASIAINVKLFELYIFNNVGIHFIITIDINQEDYSSIYLFIPIIASKPTNIILHRTSKPLPQDNKIPFYKAAVILYNKPSHDYRIDANQQKRICVITG